MNKSKKKLLISGANGLVGKHLVPAFKRENYDVFTLVRETSKNPFEIEWNSETGILQSDLSRMENLDAVIHLAGAGLTEKRWTKKRKQVIYNSRITGTKVLVDALGKLENPPPVFACASAYGYYGETNGDKILTEESPAGISFLARVCRDWEREANKAADFGIRVINLRFGLILTSDGGALEKLLLPFKFLGTGGVIANGKQYVSWIAIDDLISIIKFATENNELRGALNVTAPNPVTNLEFMKTLGKILSRPVFLKISAFLLRLFQGEMADSILINGARVMPKKLESNKFRFQFPELKNALKYLLKRN